MKVTYDVIKDENRTYCELQLLLWELLYSSNSRTVPPLSFITLRLIVPICVQIVLQKLRSQPLPLYVAILMKDAATWRSNYTVSETDLPDTAEGVFDALLVSLETHLGYVFVSHTLTYITVAHKGLSEVRLVKKQCYPDHCVCSACKISQT